MRNARHALAAGLVVLGSAVAAVGSAKTWSATARPMPGYRGTSYRIDAEGVLTEIK